jgi:hypothetical protein
LQLSIAMLAHWQAGLVLVATVKRFDLLIVIVNMKHSLLLKFSKVKFPG